MKLKMVEVIGFLIMAQFGVESLKCICSSEKSYTFIESKTQPKIGESVRYRAEIEPDGIRISRIASSSNFYSLNLLDCVGM